MPDDTKPPGEDQEEAAEAPAPSREERRRLEALFDRQTAARDAEALAGMCFDMGTAMRAKANAIRESRLRDDILAAHSFNEAARRFKALIATVDRSHKRFLDANPEVGRSTDEE